MSERSDEFCSSILQYGCEALPLVSLVILVIYYMQRDRRTVFCDPVNWKQGHGSVRGTVLGKGAVVFMSLLWDSIVHRQMYVRFRKCLFSRLRLWQVSGLDKVQDMD